MATRRRHPRRRQTRRRQIGGGKTEQAFDVIRSVYRHIGSPGSLIAAIYNTREIYGKCPESAPRSQLGYNGHREVAIPERYGRPDPHKKPLNSVIRCAFNFFNDYANEYRREEGGHDELRQAMRITNELRLIFETLVDADPEKAPTGGKIKRADRLFLNIREHMGRETGAAGGAGDAVREHIKAAERREKEREREARAAAAAAAERAATAAAEAEAAAAWAYKAAVEAEAFGTNLGTARRNWEYAHRHSMAPTGGAGNHYSPMAGRWGKAPSSPM